jgi:hypothetical protein
MKYLSLLTIVLIGCTKEQITVYNAKIINKTSHSIVIKPYFQGAVPNEKTVHLEANQSFEIATGTDRGIVPDGGFDSYYLSGSDSIAVVFDGSYRMVHYFLQPAILAPRHYLITSNRNLYNKDNYTYTFTDVSKNRWENRYEYNITEQDYLDTQ